MQILRHVDSKLLAELLVQASKAYAQHKDRQSQASDESGEGVLRPPGQETGR